MPEILQTLFFRTRCSLIWGYVLWIFSGPVQWKGWWQSAARQDPGLDFLQQREDDITWLTVWPYYHFYCYPAPDSIGDGVFSIDFFDCLFISFFSAHGTQFPRAEKLITYLILCLFISLLLRWFVSLLARLQENGWTDLHKIFREGAEWAWDDVI